jgi:hypothetical protein
MVMLVYRLHGGQHRYRGNVINFPQDVQEFTTRLSRHLSSLNVLVVHYQSANDSVVFRDFKVRCNKVARALLWLKGNNHYYADITIDNEILQSLSEDNSIIDIFPQLQDDQLIDNNLDDIENGNDAITHTFMPSLLTNKYKEAAINDTLERVQNQNPHVLWPEIKGSSINEFQTVRYIMRIFPTLYSTSQANLRAEHVRDIKPVKYFKHLIWYKDGKFA